MTNTELLNSPLANRLLDSVEQQKRFILKQAAEKLPCPNCGAKQNQFEAASVAVDDFDLSKPSNNYTFTCISCKRELKEAVPMFRAGHIAWHWMLVPIKGEQ